MTKNFSSKTVKPVLSRQSNDGVKNYIEGRWLSNTGQYSVKMNIWEIEN